MNTHLIQQWLKQQKKKYVNGKALISLNVGVDVSTVTRWAQGHSEPQAHNLTRLAKVLGVSLEDLCKESHKHG